MRILILPVLLAASLLVSLAPARAQPVSDTPHVRLTLIPETTTIQPGQTLTVAIRQDIDPDWHTYWINPGDSGATPVINWTLPEGTVPGPIEWPAPKPIPYAGLTNYGYAGQVTLLQGITFPQTLPGNPVTLTADIEILVCHEICIPETSTHTVTLNDGPAQDNSALIAAARDTMPRSVEWLSEYRENGSDFEVMLSLPDNEALPAITPGSVAFLPEEWGMVKAPALTRFEQPDPHTLILRQARDTRPLSEVGSFHGVVNYADENGEHSIRIPLDPSGQSNIPPSAAATTEPPTAGTASLSFTTALFFAFLGGLVLNLMPCVFPVLSIKALKLLELRSKGYSSAAFHGIAYTAGVLVSFAIIGGILIAVQFAGGESGWGFQLQNPLIVLFLAYLLFIIGLNLSGVFDVSGSFIGFGSSLSAKEGKTGAFFTGVLATLVATPCSAPFMAGALGFALLQPPAIAMMIFLAMGFGLAAPYLILSLIPAFTRLLPRPGHWMITFRQFLAFPMFSSAAWMVWVLSMQSGSPGLQWALTGMLAIAFALWLLSHRPARAQIRLLLSFLALTGFALALIPFFNASLLHPEQLEAQKQLSSVIHEPYSAPRLEEALAGRDPVFVYMTAAWCITCKVNEKIAINTAQTDKLFAEHNVTVLKGDWTSQDPEITKFLSHYGRNGVPLYIYFGAVDSATGQRPEAIILPQILTPGTFAGLLNQ